MAPKEKRYVHGVGDFSAQAYPKQNILKRFLNLYEVSL